MAALTGRLVLIVLCFLSTTTLALFPFRNTSLDWNVRVNDLVGRLTINEIIDQLSHGGAGKPGTVNPSPAIPRLSIEPYQWDTECLRGAVQSGNATSFPQAIGLAATFSASLVHAVAEATSVEVRAKHTDFVRRGVYHDHTGVSCFSPVINIMRHPLWGRNQETYGEDPYLSGKLSQGFVSGLQGTDPRYIRANAVCKHFDVHGGPEDIPVSRLSFDAKVSERDWRTTYLPQFKMCVEAGSFGILCSYNSINGIPSCANKKLLTDILRTEWGFNGYVISDEGATEFIIKFHKYINNTVDAAAICLRAGLNIELPGYSGLMVYESLQKALAESKVTREDIVQRVKPLFYTRMRLGEFDPPEMNPYSKLNLSVIQSSAHQQLSLKAAMQSFVLLKNSLLPLKLINGTHVNRVGVLGPMANNPEQLFGDYSADFDPKFTVIPLNGLERLGNSLNYAAGCTTTNCTDYIPGEVEEVVQNSDITFLCLGTGQALESENIDRASMLLPGQQLQLLKDAIKYVPSPGRLVVLLFSAAPLDMSIADAAPEVVAIIQCFFPAQAAGLALYNVITNTGPNSNPAGRLPYTWYSSDAQVPSMTDYSMANRTYRYFEARPLYPFGYGLSYSNFNYSNLVIQPTKIKAGQNVTVAFNVTNLGIDGDEVNEIYISWISSPVPTPRYQLVGFNREHIHKSESMRINFTITSEQMAVWVDKQGFEVLPGVIVVYAGGQLPNQKKKLPSNVLSGTFTIYA